ncbi:MAG: Ig-like domain-containing protein [Anaerovoracaceae bacterium]|jgi:hypothetical protein
MKYTKYFALLMIILLLFLPLPVLGEDQPPDSKGPGDGSGGGAGKVIRLTLVKAYPSDKADRVPLDVIIQLNFNKNVSNVSVLPDNQKSFHLTSSSGEVVPITLYFPDDQIQREYKREVVIKPEKPLAPNTDYRIAVDRSVKAKNGTYIDNAHIVTFTTGTQSTGEENAMLLALGDNVHTFNSDLPETDQSRPLSKEELLEGPPDEGLPTQVLVIIMVAVIALLAIGFTLLVLQKRRKER